MSEDTNPPDDKSIEREIMQDIGEYDNVMPFPVPKSKEDYTAFGIIRDSNPCEGLLIYYGDDIEAEMPYLNRVESIGIKDHSLFMFFNHCTLEIKGERFPKNIITRIKEREVKHIHKFDEKRFNQPCENEPIIISITRHKAGLDLAMITEND